MGESQVRIDKSGLERELAILEFPGRVDNPNKLISSLGGISKISQAFCGEKKRLELRFHHKNVYNKPACGDLHQTAGILVKVRIPKKPEKPGELTTHNVEILGRCKKVIKFDSPFDYQYLPVAKDEKTGESQNIYEKIVPRGFPDPEWWSENDKPLMCVPGVFARVDTIPSNLYRREQKITKNTDTLDVSRNKPNEVTQFQSFNLTDPFPTKPLPDVVKRMAIKYISDSQLERVTKLFEDCPIWNRVALMYESQLTNEKLKPILPSVAYYFTSGPWRTFYARLGYDPRKDFQSRYYQMIDFRIRCKPGVTEHIKIKAKARQSSTRAEFPPLGASTSRQQTSQGVVQDINYPYFEQGRLPRYRQCIYRYCDLKVPEIIEMLEKIPTPLSGATCNEKTGWLPPCFDDQCRQILNSYVKEQLQRQQGQDAEADDDLEDEEYTEEDGDELDEEFEQLFEEMDY